MTALADDTFLANERRDLLTRFSGELAKASGDGSKKRLAGEKPPWYIDPDHEAAIFSHITKWKKGELVDPDSKAHPLVHAAWRCLAIACQATGNVPVVPCPWFGTRWGHGPDDVCVDCPRVS